MIYLFYRMKRNPNRTAWLIAILFSALQTFAQSGKLFNTDNQLSSSFVAQVMEDHKGYIWIATRNGLNVYDGYNFTVFTKDKKDNQGFSNNYVNCLGKDKKNNIIVGTINGIMVYDGAKFKSLPMTKDGKEVKCYINQILSRRNGEVWICTSGYGMMRINDSYTRCETIKGVLHPYTYIYSAMEDHQGRVWVITEDFKLMRLEKNGKLTKHILGINDQKIKRVTEDKRGDIIFASEKGGIIIMKAGTNTFQHLENINITDIDDIYVSRNNKLYIGSNGWGITMYDLNSGRTTPNPFFSNQVNLSKAKVNSIIEDKQGNIWFAMLQKGVFMQPNKSYDFSYMGYRLGKYNLIGDNCVTSVLKASNGKIWVGTDKDCLYNMSADMHTNVSHFTNTPSTILSICEAKNGNIWIGSYRDGVGYVDTTGNYHNVDVKMGNNLSVFDIKCDPTGSLWLATMGNGLVCLRADGTVKQYKKLKNADSNPKINSLPNDYLAKLAFSKDYSKLYVASSIGLCCLDIKTNSWTKTFGKNCLNQGTFSHCVQTDYKDRIWYGTEEGIYVYNLKNLSHPRRYTTANGLSSNGIAFITEDAKGRMWVGTTHGLNCINPENDNIKIYYVENGLQSNEFSDGAVFAANDGKFILMGGTGGLNWFNPLIIKSHKSKLNVFISNFIVGNASVYPEMESGFYTITDKPVYESDCFNLSHDDSSFSLQLTTLTYNNVEQISYAYSINGEEWHTIPPGQNEIAFSHMPAGKYKFRIKALANGQESSIREFKVVVHPAWYASVWARLVYLLILCGLVCIYIKHRKKKERDRLVLQQHIHAEEMGEAKLKFFMNISHEIRTPLTLIIPPLLSLIKEDKDPHRQGIYDIIRKNSERILHLINQMMDLRKIDKGQMVMRMSETEMVSFMQEEYELFKQQAIAKNIDFKFTHDADKQPLWIDRNNFDKVLMNLLSNAFKFTPTGGKILMSLTHTDAHAYISIKDNGVGIPKDKLETIFQRFYQSPTSSTDRNIGTGIGLDLARSLVELHYGTISARNNEGEKGSKFDHGSEFIIRIPLGKEHLKPEELIAEEEVKEEENLELAEAEKEEQLAENNDHPAEALNNSATTSTLAKGAKAEIVIVEDEEDIQDYLKTQLSSDFKIRTYPNGKVALNEILKNKPDLIISDIMMPEMDGTALCTKLKSNINTNDVPIILLTAMSREEDQLNGLQTGADAYIMKPFNMDILRRSILNLLSVRRTLRNKFSGKESQEDKVKDVELKSGDDLLMDKVMQVINDNMMDEELNVEMIAKQVGISRVHLHRKMKDLTNQTPHSFIRNLRLKQAAKLLRESHKNVTEVMYVCGFSNPASFSTMFKNLYGCSPRDYMNEQQDKE
mgnify:FL=1